jgi:hypothetical protein
MKMKYEDFYLHVGWPDERGQYPIHVIQSPRGETRQPVWQKNNLNLPNFRNILDYLSELIAEPDEVEDFGKALHRFLFPSEVYDIFKRSREEKSSGIRIRLRIDPEELSLLPWEYCYDEETRQFLALERETPITRYIAEGFATPATLTMPHPVKMVVVLAAPRDQPELDIDREEDGIRRALKDIPANLTVLRHATIEKLHDTLLDIEPQILHFSGHGVLKDGLGALALENPETRNTDALTAKQVRGLVNRLGITMTVLNACETAKHSSRDALMGVAQALIREGIPAVIAMQFLVSETVSLMFTRRLYDFMFRGDSLEQIVTETRVGIDINFDNDNISWGIPVLFMRSKDGLLWKPEATHRRSGLDSLKTEDLKIYASARPTQASTTESIMLKKVHRKWVIDLLSTAIPNAERRIEFVLQREIDGTSLSGKTLLTVFDEMDNCFLLLGAPGAGKTIALCELIRDLILRASDDDKYPIPVVLRLATWRRGHRQDLNDWVNEQIHQEYGLGKTHIVEIRERGLLLLLDGLDEVHPEEQQSCVEAINNYCADAGWINIVVTCRSGEYTNLQSSRISLKIPESQVIRIMPLGPHRITQFLNRLDRVGIDVTHMHSLLENERTPLMTDVILQTYEGKSVGDVEKIKVSDIWENYVERKFEDEDHRRKLAGTSPPYEPAITKKYLSWLARQLGAHTQDLHRFYLEEIQPDWLSKKGMVGFYLTGFLILLIIASIAVQFEVLTFLPILFGEEGVQNFLSEFTRITVPLGSLWVASFIWIISRRSSRYFGPVIIGLMSGCVIGSMLWIPYREMPTLALIGGGIAAVAAMILFRKVIRILGFSSKIVCVKRKKWDWQKAINGLLVGIIVVFLVGFISDVSRAIFLEGMGFRSALGQAFTLNTIVWWNWVLPGLFCWGFFFFLVFGLGWGEVVLKDEVALPNQGIIDSGKTGVLMGIGGIGAGLIFSLVIGVPCYFGLGWKASSGLCIPGDLVSLLSGLGVGMASGFLLGLIFGLIFGGFAWIQHYLVRSILYLEHRQFPWRFEKFLNYACKLNLLRNVGGGYEFVDQDLQAHFAHSEFV